MARKTQLLLRNQIVRHLNNWQQLGCFVQTGESLFLARFYKVQNSKHKAFKHDMLVTGVARDGRAIMIYPMMIRWRVPQRVALLMEKYSSRGAIVGCAQHIHDAWDIVSNNEAEYKRKKRTYHFLRVLEKARKNQKEFSDE